MTIGAWYIDDRGPTVGWELTVEILRPTDDEIAAMMLLAQNGLTTTFSLGGNDWEGTVESVNISLSNVTVLGGKHELPKVPKIATIKVRGGV